MVIEILGPGCKKCGQLYEQTLAAVQALGLDAEVKKIEDMATIASYGVMSTPALAVDKKVKSVGRVLSQEQIMTILKG